MPGQDPEPLSKTIFDLSVTMCDRFPSLSPFTLRREKFREMIVVLGRTIDHAKRQPLKDEQGNPLPKGSRIVRDKNGKIIRIMRPATSDSWA